MEQFFNFEIVSICIALLSPCKHGKVGIRINQWTNLATLFMFFLIHKLSSLKGWNYTTSYAIKLFASFLVAYLDSNHGYIVKTFLIHSFKIFIKRIIFDFEY